MLSAELDGAARETDEAEARSTHFIHAVFQVPYLGHRYLQHQAIPDSAAVQQASTYHSSASSRFRSSSVKSPRSDWTTISCALATAAFHSLLLIFPLCFLAFSRL